MSTRNEKEFLKQVTEHQAIVHKVCHVYCKDEEHRKDLFQEVLIQLWKSYGSFEGRSRFSTWMYRVSLNVVLQYVRKGKVRPAEVALTPALKNISDQAPDPAEDDLKLLYNAIDQLNDVEKAIMMLYLDDKSNEEIAEIVGITQNYVRVRMNRARQKLKKILNPQ